MKISALKKKQLAEVIAENKALAATLTDAKPDFTTEEQTKFDANVKKAENLKMVIVSFEQQEKLEGEASSLTARVVAGVDAMTTAIASPDTKIVIPATVSMNSSLKVFKTREQAYKFGIYISAVVLNHGWAIKRAQNFFDFNALQSEGVNVDGGFLVPEEFSAEMIMLREKKGIFRQKCRVIPMSRDTFTMGRRVTGLTAYPTAEGAAGTVSTAKMDRIKLVAQKWTVLATMTKELEEDAVINEADNLFQEMAYALAAAEDNAGFNGDGTGTYSGIVGLKNALGASCKVTQGTGTTWAAMVAADIAALMGKIPDFEVPMNQEFYCNKAFYFNVLRRIAQAAGGTTGEMIVNGIRMGMYDGYPVNFVSSMPASTASGQISCYFGDLALAAKFGDRRGIRLERTDQGVVGGVELFTTDEVGLKATERFDINVHERGTSTASDPAGPIAALVNG